jgi:spermidine/putrescine transport system permease protein
MKPKGEIRFGEKLTLWGQIGRSAITSGPSIWWVTMFLLVPLIAIGVLSFMSFSDSAVAGMPFTIDNYKRLIGFGEFGFEWETYPLIMMRSILLGVGTAVLCLLAGLPLAFFVAGLSPRGKNMALTLIMIPFWTNLLIRTYAWQVILGPQSWISRGAAAIGLIEAGDGLYPGTIAVFIGMVCDYLPFMVLPLYSSVEKIDWTLSEAAADLGANAVQRFRHAVLPQIVPGLVAGVILVLIPAMGQFVIPDLLGGGKTVMLGNAISQQFGPSQDWPFGSAIAFLGMGSVMIGLWFYARYAAEKGGEIL